MRRAALWVLLPVLSACSSTDTGTIQILIGEETDTFTATPVPSQIVISALDTSGDLTTLATASYPTTSIDLGQQNENTVANIQVEGEDPSGNELIFGQSVQVQYGAIASSTLPVFVQRVGENARVPNPLADSRSLPTLATLSSRFLIVAAGSDSSLSSTTVVYDFAQFDEVSSPPTMPVVPSSMAIVGTVGLLISSGSPGSAAYFDFSGSSPTVTGVDPPGNAPFTWGDVAGGQTIYDTSGYIYVVGATQTSGSPTTAILQINTNDLSNTAYPTGNLAWVQLSEPRRGASAAMVPGVELVVAGGSASAAGVEILPVGKPMGTPCNYPFDPSVGSGMAELANGGTQFLIAGGALPASGADAGTQSAGVRVVDVSNCVGDTYKPTPWSSLPEPLTNCSVFSLNSGAQGFLVGSEIGGLTHTFVLNSTAAIEIPTKVPHTNAVGFLSPVNSVLIVGGNDAGEFESFIPTPITGYDPALFDGGTPDAAGD